MIISKEFLWFWFRLIEHLPASQDAENMFWYAAPGCIRFFYSWASHQPASLCSKLKIIPFLFIAFLRISCKYLVCLMLTYFDFITKKLSVYNSNLLWTLGPYNGYKMIFQQFGRGSWTSVEQNTFVETLNCFHNVYI